MKDRISSPHPCGHWHACQVPGPAVETAVPGPPDFRGRESRHCVWFSPLVLLHCSEARITKSCRLIHLMCTLQGVQYTKSAGQPSPPSSSELFILPDCDSRPSRYGSLPLPPPQPPVATIPLSVAVNLTAPGTSCMQS